MMMVGVVRGDPLVGSRRNAEDRWQMGGQGHRVLELIPLFPLSCFITFFPFPSGPHNTLSLFSSLSLSFSQSVSLFLAIQSHLSLSANSLVSSLSSSWLFPDMDFSIIFRSPFPFNVLWHYSSFLFPEYHLFSFFLSALFHHCKCYANLLFMHNHCQCHFFTLILQ